MSVGRWSGFRYGRWGTGTMLGRPWLVHDEHRSSSESKGSELIRETPRFSSEVPGSEAGLPPDSSRNDFLLWATDTTRSSNSDAKSNTMSEEQLSTPPAGRGEPGVLRDSWCASCSETALLFWSHGRRSAQVVFEILNRDAPCSLSSVSDVGTSVPADTQRKTEVQTEQVRNLFFLFYRDFVF